MNIKTVRNYTLLPPFFWLYWPTFAIGVGAILAQLTIGNIYKQPTDLSENFFIFFIVTQFTHLSWAHLTLNLAGLGLIIWGFEHQLKPWTCFHVQAFSFPAVAWYLTTIEPLSWYCGLSGALHFQLTVFLMLAWAHDPSRPKTFKVLVILSLGLIFKLLWEGLKTQTPEAWLGGPIAIEAHRGGVLLGVCYAALLLLLRKLRNTQNNPATP